MKLTAAGGSWGEDPRPPKGLESMVQHIIEMCKDNDISREELKLIVKRVIHRDPDLSEPFKELAEIVFNQIADELGFHD